MPSGDGFALKAAAIAEAAAAPNAAACELAAVTVAPVQPSAATTCLTGASAIGARTIAKRRGMR